MSTPKHTPTMQLGIKVVITANRGFQYTRSITFINCFTNQPCDVIPLSCLLIEAISYVQSLHLSHISLIDVRQIRCVIALRLVRVLYTFGGIY